MTHHVLDGGRRKRGRGPPALLLSTSSALPGIVELSGTKGLGPTKHEARRKAGIGCIEDLAGLGPRPFRLG